MNLDQINGIARVVVPVFCAWLAAKGFNWLGDEGVQAEIAAVVIGIIAVAWSWWTHSDAQKIKAAARVDPQIKIQIPDHVINSNRHIADAVRDDHKYPNVSQLYGEAPVKMK